MMNTTRFLGGFNLDGKLTYPVRSSGLVSPFFQIGRPKHEKDDETWGEFWKNLRGAKSELEITGAVHGSFTDIPTILSALDLQLSSDQKKILQGLAGSLDWSMISDIVAAIVNSVDEYVIGSGIPFLLSGADVAYPEVKKVRSKI